RRYQIRNGLQVTGEINPETLRSLNLNSNPASSSQPASKPAVAQSNNTRPDQSAHVAQNPSPPPQAPRERDRQFEANPAFSSAPYQPMPRRVNNRLVLAEVQRQLMSRGYYRGSIDG